MVEEFVYKSIGGDEADGARDRFGSEPNEFMVVRNNGAVVRPGLRLVGSGHQPGGCVFDSLSVGTLCRLAQ